MPPFSNIRINTGMLENKLLLFLLITTASTWVSCDRIPVTLSLNHQGGFCSDTGPMWLFPTINAVFDDNYAVEAWVSGELVAIGTWQETDFSNFTSFEYVGGCGHSTYREWFEIKCTCEAVANGHLRLNDFGSVNMICHTTNLGANLVCSAHYGWFAALNDD